MINFSVLYSNVKARYKKSWAGRHKLHIWASFILLICAAIYGAWYATLTTANNSDSLIYPYLFNGFTVNDVLLPGNHANIVKLPLILLQASLPYNLISFSLVTIFLIVATFVGWVVLLIKIFGRQYLTLICIVMVSIILGSSLLNYQLSENVIRNIEYPLGLLFILFTSLIASGKPFKNHYYKIAGVIIAFLFAMSVAGDSLLIYAFTLPLLFLIGLSLLYNGRISAPLLKATFFVIITTLVGLLTRGIIDWTNFIDLSHNSVSAVSIVSTDALMPSIGQALVQLLDLSGANIFGKSISAGTVLAGANLGIVVLGFAGIVHILLTNFKKFKKGETSDNMTSFILMSLSLSFITTFSVYIILGMVLTVQADGSFVDSGQSRYISLLPFILITGFIVFIKDYFQKSKSLIAVFILIISLVTFPAINHGRLIESEAAHKTRETFLNISNTAQTNDVGLILSGYWLGASTRFWSNDYIKFVSIKDCHFIYPDFNTRKSWYNSTNSPYPRTALVIDRSGIDKHYWENCSNEQLQSIYGQPSAIHQITNTLGPKPIEFWIYDRDIRSNITKPDNW